MMRKQTYGNYPAQLNLMKAVYEGTQVPIDAALRIETRYFIKTLMTPQAQAMIRSLFLSKQELDKGAVRPANVPKYDVKKVTVLGAGMMGAGIAYVQAMAGIETVLIDQTQEAADKGKAHVEGLLKKRLSRGQMTQEKGDALLGSGHRHHRLRLIKGSDLVVEAVFENREIKAEVTKTRRGPAGRGAIFGSNTSTLPITGLPKASVRPEDFIGIHFFSPVDKMMLVEIIMGEKTGQEAIAKSLDYVLKIKKTPIVVNDSRGFYTSRCFSTFVQEGMAMLEEGIAPALIDNVGRMTGMPRGPLEMHDDVALDLSYKIGKQTKKDLGDKYVPSGRRHRREDGRGRSLRPQERQGLLRLRRKVAQDALGGPGRTDAGHQPRTPEEPGATLIERLKTRLLYRQAVEAARCWEEGVIDDPREADLGAILGWGFAPWTGGPITLIDRRRRQGLRRDLRPSGQQYGERFKAAGPAARHGREGRDLLRPLRRQGEGGGLSRYRSLTDEKARRQRRAFFLSRTATLAPYRSPTHIQRRSAWRNHEYGDRHRNLATPLTTGAAAQLRSPGRRSGRPRPRAAGPGVRRALDAPAGRTAGHRS
jgi:3-hydroxyacyl-CoA dehydrogenase/enoyl-CoA hydratase/3-hydroxybutyryl-CoA epimerase